jgi:hypothetical protein
LRTIKVAERVVTIKRRHGAATQNAAGMADMSGEWLSLENGRHMVICKLYADHMQVIKKIRETFK